MTQPRKFHLFNCDNLYELSIVEDLLKATKAKLGFEFSVEKHNFTLSEMSELSTKTIPEMKMDFAMFVVHAHESVLLINNDNLEHGYAKVYRALLQATGGKVIIIIGGDDSYKSEDEEDRSVISQWARRKIISQFSHEFFDGSKRFIFSWNKKHREIHEEALLHYFDPNKKGQKFEYQPKPKEPERGKSGQTSSGSFPEQKYQSVDEQRQEGIESSNSSSAVQRRQIIASGSSYKSAQTIPLEKYQSTNEQRGEGFRRRSSSSSEQRREDFSVGRSRSAEGTGEYNSFSRPNTAEQSRDDYSFGSTTGTAMATSDNEYGAKSIEPFSASSGGTKFTELAILGCNVSGDSMQAVRTVPRPNPQTRFSRAFPEKTNDASGAVAESFSTHSGQLQSDPLQNPSDCQSGYGWNTQNEQQPTTQAAASAPATSKNGEPVLLRSILRYGRISEKLEDLQMWDPSFTVPEYISDSLFEKYQNIPEAGVRIVLAGNNSELQWSVDRALKNFSRKKEIQMERNETLLLKTRLRKGQVSFEESDVHFRYGNWQIPPHVVESLQEEHKSTSGADLIISLKDGNLHIRVKIGSYDKITNFASR